MGLIMEPSTILFRGEATSSFSLIHRKDASRLHEFLVFCGGLGIKHKNAFPTQEDLLITWATPYAG